MIPAPGEKLVTDPLTLILTVAAAVRKTSASTWLVAAVLPARRSWRPVWPEVKLLTEVACSRWVR